MMKEVEDKGTWWEGDGKETLPLKFDLCKESEERELWVWSALTAAAATLKKMNGNHWA